MKNRRHKATQIRQRQSGLILIAVLVCLGVIVALIYSSMQISMRQKRILDRELQMEQTRWLVMAAANHARHSDSVQAGDFKLEPPLSNHESAVITIEPLNKGDASTANVSARIGIEDRPETQTKQSLQIQRKVDSETESSED